MRLESIRFWRGSWRPPVKEMAQLEPGHGKADVKKSLTIYVGCLAALWLIAVVVVGIRSTVFHLDYPDNTLFFIPSQRFTDFTIFYPRFKVFGNPEAFFSRTGFPFTYPAPLLLCFLFLWRITKEPLGAYLGIICAFSCLVVVMARRALPNGQGFKRLGTLVVASAVFCFPLLFLLDRANLEGLVWIATAAGLYCFSARRYTFAAVFLASATSMKMFPGVLLLLFLAKRRYRELALSVVLCGAFTVGSLWVTGPSIGEANRGIAMGIDYFFHTQILQFHTLEIGFDHTIYSLIKWVALFTVDSIPDLNALLPRLYIPYAVATVLGFAAIYGLRLRRMPILNQILALSAISVTLPFVSYDYTLVHLIVPLILFVLFLLKDVATERVSLQKHQILAILLPFVVILGPMSFFILMDEVGIGGQVKGLALIYLIGATLRFPFPSSLFGELEGSYF
jgi:hypothetical protein